MRAFILTFWLLLCLTTPSQAQADSSARILKVSFVFTPPLISLNTATGAFEGIIVERTRRQASRCGLEVAFVHSPSWSRAYKMTVDGVSDAIIPTNLSEKRKKDLRFPDHALFNLNMSVMTLKTRGTQAFTGLEILAGKRVGKLDNALIEEKFDQFVASGNVRLSQRPTIRALIESLLRGRVDYVVGDVPSGLYYAGQIGAADKVMVLEPPVGIMPQYLAFSRKSALMANLDTPVAQCLLHNKPFEDSASDTDQTDRP